MLQFNIFTTTVLSICLVASYASGMGTIDGSKMTIKAFATGFNSNSSQVILQSLLGYPNLLADEDKNGTRLTLLDYPDKSDVISIFHDESQEDCSISFIYLDSMILLDENIALNQFINAYKSLKSTNFKSPIVIVFSGPADSVNDLDLLLRDAWSMMDEDGKTSDSLMEKHDIQIILLPRGAKGEDAVYKDSIEAVQKNLNALSERKLKLSEVLDNVKVPISVEIPNFGPQAEGIELCKKAAEIALEFALVETQKSLSLLNEQNSPEAFSLFLDDILSAAQTKLMQYVEENFKVDSQVQVEAQGGMKLPLVLKDIKVDLARSYCQRLLPLYQRQLSFLMSDATDEFNGELGEMEISIKVLDELNELKESILSDFSQLGRRLVPKSAPRGIWEPSAEVMKLRQVLEDFIYAKKCEYQTQGVLERGVRKPVDVSFNLFLNHPLGRDHRQDPLGARPRDEVIYDPILAQISQSKAGSAGNTGNTVKPVIARQLLQQKIQNIEADGGRQWALRLMKKDSEFAREMLMFPLSIKNPGVPFSGGRRSRGGRKSGPPKKDTARVELGPERFIRWDIEPLDEVRENLDELVKLDKKNVFVSSFRDKKKNVDFSKPLTIFNALPSVESVFDQALNVIPVLNKGYYRHPPYNYGPKYEPTKPDSGFVSEDIVDESG